MCLVVYFSTQSGNTLNFVQRLGMKAVRIPLSANDEPLKVAEPYVLICPTYADGEGKGAVPKQVIHFLNDETNRLYLKGVIAAGNRNFGQFYAYAGDVIAQRCQVPFLYRFELRGMPEDIENVRKCVSDL